MLVVNAEKDNSYDIFLKIQSPKGISVLIFVVTNLLKK
jgi:hypothetical protein